MYYDIRFKHLYIFCTTAFHVLSIILSFHTVIVYEIAYVVLRKVECFIRNTDTLILAAVSKYVY